MRFEILGPVRVWAHDREVPVTAGHEQAVLAMLVLDPDNTVPTERLVDALWSDRAPRSTRGQLHSCVSRLRKHLTEGGLPGQVIVTDPAGYRLRTGVVAVDLLEFRATVADARVAATAGRRTEARARYRAALGLWRGPAFAGIDRPAIRLAAASLDEERARAVEECIEVELTLGGGGELVGELTELVNQHPYRESLHAALMLALYRADRQADALAAYQRVRRALVSELGQEPARALRELHQRILSGDESLRSVTRPTSDGGSPSPRAGHGLPRTLDDFTGRDADLAWLLEIAGQPDPYAPLVLAIDGMPGVGKTSLAVRAAHLLKERYPGGQLFIDLHGHSEHRPVEPPTALDILLRQLGVPAAHIPTELEARIARWRAELANRRVLVVLDNAATSAQVTPLLPASPGCLALVTSRRRLIDLDGARPRSVDTLQPDDAVTLLAQIAGQRVAEEPAAAADVAKRCGYLPLALRLAAARLAHRPRWRVQDLADRLSDPHLPVAGLAAGDRTVADAFALSYEQLPGPGRRMFRLLGLHPGEHFDAYSAAALAGIHRRDAQRLLDELVDVHLVDEPHVDRYRLHDLVKAYAAGLATATDPDHDRSAAVEQMLDYYLHAAVAASDHLESPMSRRNFHPGEPLRPDLRKRPNAADTAWLEAERQNLLPATRYAAACGHDRYAWQIPRAMSRFLFLRGYLDDLVETHRCGLAAVERLGDADAVATMHNYLASAYFQNGKYHSAVEHVRRTLAHRRRTGDRIGEAVARQNLATAYVEGGRHRDAADECERALAAASVAGHPETLAHALINAGALQLTLGQYCAALRYSRRGLAFARECGDARGVATAVGNVGMARARLGQLTAAHRLLTAALTARQRAGNRYAEAEALNELGAIARTVGDLHTAVANHQRALIIMRDTGFRQGVFLVYNEFARTLLQAGDVITALAFHRQVLDDATRIGHKYSRARALDGVAACLRDSDPEAARRHWHSALQLYQELAVPERYEVQRRLAALTPQPRRPA